MHSSIEPCDISDIEVLQKISIETFTETFKQDNSIEDLQNYLDQAYTLDKLQNELKNRNSMFFFLYQENNLAGYLKLNVGDAQTEAMGDDALEIERIYIKGAYQNNGFGKVFMNHVSDIAKEKEVRKIWLGVWEHNTKAIAFYERHGFIRQGQHSFFMGEDEQIDWIMTKTF